jgi:hypothetical protein
MGTPRPPDKALLFVAVLYPTEERYHRGRVYLEEKFGDIIMESPPIPWDFSDYYRDEIGEPLFKRLMFFRELVEQGSLATIKLITKEAEIALSSERRRTVNLDPGYLTSAKVVLASTKDYCHRIYLKDGIYGEVTLIFKKGRFVPHVNTYMDYRDDRLLTVLLIARTVFSLRCKGAV